jgi:hypothetical protein
MIVRMIARICLAILLLLFSCAGRTQENNNNVTLDDYFAGVPLREDFAKWFYHVRQHPFLGIPIVQYGWDMKKTKNSITCLSRMSSPFELNNRGIYSSLRSRGPSY